MSAAKVTTSASEQDVKEEVAEQKEHKGSRYFRIMHYYKRSGFFIAAIVLTIITGICPMIMNIIIGDMVTKVTTSDNFKDDVIDSVIEVAIYCACYSVLMIVKDIISGNANPWFLTDIRRALYEKLMALDIPFFDLNQTGTLLNKFTSDCAILNEVYISKFLQALSSIAQALAGIIVAFIYSWQTTLACFIGFPLCCVVYWVGECLVGRLWTQFNQSTTNASTKAEEVIAAFRTVKSFDNELLETEKFRVSLDEINRVYDKTSLLIGSKDAAIILIINCMLIGFLYFASWIIINRPSWGLENGDLMVLVSSIIFTTIGCTQALAIIDDFSRAGVSAEKVLEVLEEPIQVNQREGNVPEGSFKGKIEFKDVSFKYQTCDKYAVRHLSFEVEPGQTVALVGESGCGKSTTLQLLQRFYEIESGEILIDGTNIKSLSPQYLRSQVSIVPQSPVLFTMSIRDNIKYAKPDATDAEMSHAAEIGNAHPFIMTFPDNYNTVVEQASLSGGQKQRICISRAILMDSPILLLDEATAALDTESERLVQQSLEVARKGKTAIVVAHRLATVINADRIFVFKDGQIVESGKHQELLEKNGYYADLIKFQLQ